MKFKAAILSILVAASAQSYASMSIQFKNQASVSQTTLIGIAAGIDGMGTWAPLSGKTFTVQQAPGKNLPINTVINAMFANNYIPKAANAIIGWDAASQQFNYGWGDNTPYCSGQLCMSINVDGHTLPSVCTNSNPKGTMKSAHQKYSSSSHVVVTFSGSMTQ